MTMGPITARLQKRAVLLQEWREACARVVEHAEAQNIDGVEEAIAERSVLLERIMEDHRQYAWSDTERKQLRALEDEVERALMLCSANLRKQVGAGRRRGAAVTRYAEHARGG